MTRVIQSDNKNSHSNKIHTSLVCQARFGGESRWNRVACLFSFLQEIEKRVLHFILFHQMNWCCFIFTPFQRQHYAWSGRLWLSKDQRAVLTPQDNHMKYKPITPDEEAKLTALEKAQVWNGKLLKNDTFTFHNIKKTKPCLKCRHRLEQDEADQAIPRRR